jgi:protein-glutamine gamma-glutamyltransferase
MIKISGNIVSKDELIKDYPANSLETRIITRLSLSKDIYSYNSLNELKFDITLRINIVSAANELDKSNMIFKVFRKSKCNSHYWQRTLEGGFLLKKGVAPCSAIKDIFVNSSKYGTECATAIVIIYYKALLNILPEKLFNEMFENIHLLNWHYTNPNLYIEQFGDKKDFFPGDCKYFKNPDVNPLKPEWQGENVIYLGNGSYYGHGIGIKNGDDIINVLNNNRKTESKTSAFLLDSVTYLNSNHLCDKYYNYNSKSQMRTYKTYRPLY